MTALRRILAQHNFSDPSTTAKKYAVTFARSFWEKLVHAGGGSHRMESAAPADRKDRMIRRESTLDGFAELSANEGVSLPDLEPLTTLLVRTCHSVYRIIVLHGTTVLVQGGRTFPGVTLGQLSGSGFGGSVFKPGWIGVGLRMEICSDREFFVTSRVREITTDGTPPCGAHVWSNTDPSWKEAVH